MTYTNIEIKARTLRVGEIRNYLRIHRADFKGIDHQTDTYFQVPEGRLKLRQGNIENSLIFYKRGDDFGPKTSNFKVISVADGNGLKGLLASSLGIKVVVEKEREIYFIDNVKFHIDSLISLGNFIEIEAAGRTGELSYETQQQQCEFYMQEFNIKEEELINISYSDMVMAL